MRRVAIKNSRPKDDEQEEPQRLSLIAVMDQLNKSGATQAVIDRVSAQAMDISQEEMSPVIAQPSSAPMSNISKSTAPLADFWQWVVDLFTGEIRL